MKSSTPALAAQLPAAAVHTLMIMLATSQHDTHAASPRAAPAAPPRPAAPPQVNTSFGVVTGKARLAFSACYKPILHAKPCSHCRAPLRLPLPRSHCNAATADRTATSHCLLTRYMLSQANVLGGAEFLGIPYAMPPTGAGRFRPPQPFAGSWGPSPFAAVNFGAVCPQPGLTAPLTEVSAARGASRSPPLAAARSRRPVLAKPSHVRTWQPLRQGSPALACITGQGRLPVPQCLPAPRARDEGVAARALLHPWR